MTDECFFALENIQPNQLCFPGCKRVFTDIITMRSNMKHDLWYLSHAMLGMRKNLLAMETTYSTTQRAQIT